MKKTTLAIAALAATLAGSAQAQETEFGLRGGALVTFGQFFFGGELNYTGGDLNITGSDTQFGIRAGVRF
ncbi:MAG TPA: hypothetical protein VF647_12860 [Longimicrobium sp.]|jgi:hypothetical protein